MRQRKVFTFVLVIYCFITNCTKQWYKITILSNSQILWEFRQSVAEVACLCFKLSGTSSKWLRTRTIWKILHSHGWCMGWNDWMLGSAGLLTRALMYDFSMLPGLPHSTVVSGSSDFLQWQSKGRCSQGARRELPGLLWASLGVAVSFLLYTLILEGDRDLTSLGKGSRRIYGHVFNMPQC